jgi:eukaryotic-like serine/threonine-protein kinase
MAIKLDPKLATAHFVLGNALNSKKQFDEASAAYREAIELDPKYAEAHYNLGVILKGKKQLDEAIAEFRQAIKLDPKYTKAHYNLGNILMSEKQLDEACAEFRQVIDLQPDYAEAHCNLAHCLRMQGQLSASLDSYKYGHALGSKRQDWAYASAQWVATAERLVGLEAMLADVLAGNASATDNRERLGFLGVCRLQRRHVAAARVYADAFAADPKLADDLKGGHRYNAACAAALAAAGQGTDVGKLDDQERRQLRQQALAWLRTDLDLLSQRLNTGKPEDRQIVRATLLHWQRDADLVGVREVETLRKLADDEQAAWRKLWAEVADLLKKAGDAK